MALTDPSTVAEKLLKIIETVKPVSPKELYAKITYILGEDSSWVSRHIGLRSSRLREQLAEDTLRLIMEGSKLKAIVESVENIEKTPQRSIQPLIVPVKDNINVAGVATRLGTSYYKIVPAKSSEPVKLLGRAGAMVVAKTAMHELALGTTGVNKHTGTPVNPRCPGHVPGGSSSGSAVVVSAGLAPVALGTDTAGSSRIPAAWTGTIGLRLPKNTVALRGVVPLAPSYDSLGIHALFLTDLVAMLDVLKPGLATEFLVLAEKKVRPKLFVPQDMLETADPAIVEAFEESIQLLRGEGWSISRGFLGVPKWMQAARTIAILCEAKKSYHELYTRYRDSMGLDARFLLDVAVMLKPQQCSRAKKLLVQQVARLRLRLIEYDAVVTPTTPIPPPRLEEATWRLAISNKPIAYTWLWNVVDAAAISLPGASSLPQCNVPVGVQLASLKPLPVLLAIAGHASKILRGEA